MTPLAALPLLFGALLTAPAATQQYPPLGDSVQVRPPPPAPTTPAQDRYVQGLRTAGRGVAQLKDGLSRLARMQSRHDTLQARTAGKRLGGLCGAARGFIVNGRTQMEPNAYDPPNRKPARDLATRLDSLAAYAPTCQRSAGKTPAPIATELLGRIRAYEVALVAFRNAIGLPNR
ncbi:MAG: hypothetical protein ACREMW_11480 [Gemmatimonadales bacterium]